MTDHIYPVTDPRNIVLSSTPSVLTNKAEDSCLIASVIDDHTQAVQLPLHWQEFSDPLSHVFLRINSLHCNVFMSIVD